MTLRNKIITALTALGIAAGTYTIGTLDLECSENVVDIQGVRLCVTDEQLEKMRNDDVLAIIANDVQPEDVARIVTLSKEDPEQYSKVSGELLDKIETDTNSQSLTELHRELALEKREYLISLRDTLIAKFEKNNGIKLDDYPLHIFMIDRLLPPNASISDFTSDNAIEKLHALIQ